MKIYNNSLIPRGLWLAGGRDSAPLGSLRRARGVNQTPIGSIKSRLGSTLIYSVNAHSLYRFNDIRIQGAGFDLYYNGSIIDTGYDGSRLTFAKMPPSPDAEVGGTQTGIIDNLVNPLGTASTPDYLFIAGGNRARKVSGAGNVSNIGIDAPPDGFTATPVGGTGGPGTGVFLYHVTYLNTATGSRSNANPTPVSVTIGTSTDSVTLASLPVSSDPQVNVKEIWRTVADGAQFFKVNQIANATTTYSDTTPSADLQSTELPVDNDPPLAIWDDIVGPYLGRMFWDRDPIVGHRNKLYYSPIGRPEAVEGFILVSTDDDPIQKSVIWSNNLYTFTESRIFRILGQTEPFVAVEVTGCPGTTYPFSVTPTPLGILYRAHDGIRQFNSIASRLIGFEAIYPIFRGETAENLSPFDTSPLYSIGVFAKNEYIFSNSLQTIGFDLKENTWRDFGIGCRALYYEDDTGKIIASFNSTTQILENDFETTDSSQPIAFEIEFPAVLVDRGQLAVVQRLFIDIITHGNLVQPILTLDNTTRALGFISSTTRTLVEIPVDISARVVGLRLSGNLVERVEIFDVEGDVYAAGGTATVNASQAQRIYKVRQLDTP